MCSRKRSWISVCYISLPIGLVIFLYMLYKFLPTVFSLLLNCTPVVVFSTLLLGILLSHGEPNIPDNEDYNEHDRKSYLNTCSASNDHDTKNEKRFTHKSHVGGSKRPMKRMMARTITLGNVRRSAANKGGEENEANHIDATSASSSSSLEEDDAKNNLEQAEGLLKVGKDIDNNITVFDVDDDDKSKLDHHYDSCLGSPHQIDHKDASSGSESDSLASSSPSVANPMPLLDELDPLVPEEHSADGSAVFSDNQASDEDSGEEEVDNQDDEDDEEAHGEEEDEKEDGNKVAITWTADDQMNLVELGNSELERNRWLETLLAKRKAKKILEKNLIDLDDDMEETQQTHAQLPSINAPRRNPFDLPYDSEEVPGSAPSVLLPRQNPFDLPLELVDVEENQDHKEYAPVPQRDMFIRRHESFSIGSIFEIKQEKRTSRFKPYFGAEKTESEEKVHGEISEISDSKLSSTLESDVSHIKHNAEPGEQYSQSIEHHIKSVDVERVENQMNRSNNHATQSSNSHQNTETEDDSSVDTVLHSPASSNVERACVIDEEYESSCSNPSDNPKISTPERTVEAEETNDSLAVEPVYDSSPTATDKSHSNSILDEALHISDKGGFSPRPTTERSTVSDGGTEEGQQAANEIPWIAPSSLAFVEHIESVSGEVSMIKEHEVIGDELSKVHEDFGSPVLSVLPESEDRNKILGSNLPPMENEPGKES